MEVGSTWLKCHFKLDSFELGHRSYIGSNNKTVVLQNGNIDQFYGQKYAPSTQTPLAHWEFALKYDDFDLPFFKSVLGHIGKEEVTGFIRLTPSGKYARITGFLYEFLFREELITEQTSGNYFDLLDKANYVTGKIRKNSKWRINNNLLGDNDFCPIVKRTEKLNELLLLDFNQTFIDLKKEYSVETLNRAISYLYRKETRSSFEIEHEKPSPRRTERFITLLQQAGKSSPIDFLTEQILVNWQHVIVDPRFATTGFRDFQNYVGQSLPNYIEQIHYICPPPQFVYSLMNGLKLMEQQTIGVDSLVRASILSFGFVFIHPFEDGNGRLHRFLIHDILVRDKLLESGIILPVSAHILSNIRQYDSVLEHYSKQIMKHINFEKDDKGEITVTNPLEIEPFYRYPNLTTQTLFLANAIQETLTKELPEELSFIQHYDELKQALQEIVDMPDKYINLMILFLHQNKGFFPKRRRNLFEKLTDSEIKEMENRYEAIFY